MTKNSKAKPKGRKPAAKKSSDGKRVTIRAKCELDATEVAARADEMATLVNDVNQQKIALKEYAKCERAEIKSKETRILELKDAVMLHEEDRDVEAEETLRGSQVVTVRLDTGQVVEERAATAADKQSDLFG